MSELKGMCVINPEIATRLAPLVGTQLNIMQQLGISWNTWIKIAAGLPIRMSVGQRLKSRLVADKHFSSIFDDPSPSAANHGDGNEAALDHMFLIATPVEKSAGPVRLRRVAFQESLAASPA